MVTAAAAVLGVLGAAMAFAGAAAAGALLGARLSKTHRLRGGGRLWSYVALTAALLLGGGVLTRPEARAVVALFAVVPFLVGGLFAVLDQRGGQLRQ
jgi:hypothetical protein